MRKLHLVYVTLIFCIEKIFTLDNGLALTPPMGFMTWQRYRCTTDCENYPKDCISEKLMKSTADLMVKDGYLKAGYKYLVIDDCWLARKRNDQKLQPDVTRFPSGIKALSDYVHGKGLKFGIYEDYGNKTCAGYPGVLGFLEEDANTFAEWQVDYVKLDTCYSVEYRNMEKGYVAFSKYLNRTGRPMVFSCSWPAYFQRKSVPVNYKILKTYCNLWRNYGDIQDSYDSMMNIVEWYALTQDSVAPHAGPGHWNDPDMLVIGNFGLTLDQSKQQMAIWAILAAPLFISADLENMKPEFREILLNKDIIAINQDPLGIQGRRVFIEEEIHYWKRPISPKVGKYYSYALAAVSKRDDGLPLYFNMSLNNLGLDNPYGYKIKDLFLSKKSLPCRTDIKTPLKLLINPMGVVFLRLEVCSEDDLAEERC